MTNPFHDWGPRDTKLLTIGVGAWVLIVGTCLMLHTVLEAVLR